MSGISEHIWRSLELRLKPSLSNIRPSVLKHMKYTEF